MTFNCVWTRLWFQVEYLYHTHLSLLRIWSHRPLAGWPAGSCQRETTNRMSVYGFEPTPQCVPMLSMQLPHLLSSHGHIPYTHIITFSGQQIVGLECWCVYLASKGQLKWIPQSVVFPSVLIVYEQFSYIWVDKASYWYEWRRQLMSLTILNNSIYLEPKATNGCHYTTTRWNRENFLD